MKDINQTVITNVEASEEELISKLNKKARWGIKRAEKNGLVVEESTDWETFYEIYQQNMKQKGQIVRSLDFVKQDSTVLFLCKLKDKVIAGVTITFDDRFYSKDIPRLSKNASLSDYLELQPNNLLYWKCLLWAKKKGYKNFDWSGYSKAVKGVSSFKKRWGQVIEYKKDYPIHLAIGRKLIRNSSTLKWIHDKMRGRK